MARTAKFSNELKLMTPNIYQANEAQWFWREAIEKISVTSAIDFEALFFGVGRFWSVLAVFC